MTIKDIAEKCGVSVATVSRVINDQPYVKQEVRNLVMRVIEEEHFVPHEGAAALARSGDDAVGLIVRGISNPFFNEMINITMQKLYDEGLNPYLHQISSKEDELKASLSIAKSMNLKGIIFLGGRFDHTVDDYRGLDVPFVCATFTNSFGNLPANFYSSVTIDDVEEAKKVVRYLAQAGHEKIGIVLPSVNDQSISELRYKGYVQAMQENRLEVSDDYIIETGGYGLEEAYSTMKKILEKKTECTAFFAISDTIGLAVIKALNEYKIRIPEDVAVMSIDGIEITNYTIPTLTTLVQPREEMATRSCEIIKKMVEDKGNYSHEILSTNLRKGDSVLMG